MTDAAPMGEGRNKRGPLRATARATGGLLRFIVKLSLVIAFIAGGLLVGGFAQFVSTVTNAEPPADVEKAEAIVVLTGGSERIAQALDLLEEGKGERLLISGVNPVTRVADLASVHTGHDEKLECCVDVEKVSTDTIGNAIETRKWMSERGYGSLILVTSGYHMPRSLMEFARQMKGVSVRPWPLRHSEFSRDDWWKRPATLRLMVSEYVKYVGAWSRDYVRRDMFDSVRASIFGS